MIGPNFELSIFELANEMSRLMSNQSLDFLRGVWQLIPAIVVSYCLTKKQLVEAWGGASKLVTQMLWAAKHRPDLNWLTIVRKGKPGVEVLIDRESADRAYARYLAGEQPPLMPSQIRSREKSGKAVSKRTKN